MLIVSGIVRVRGMPLAAATNAKAIPVLPLVGSMSSFPGGSNPLSIASWIIADPIRHLTEYAGFLPSILAKTVAPAPEVTRLSLTKGVLPIERELSAYIVMNNLDLLSLLEKI